MSQRYEELRVVYVGYPEIVDSLREDFLKTGAQMVGNDPDRLAVGQALAKRLSKNELKGSLPTEQSLAGATVFFFRDVFSVARFLPFMDAEMVLVDERRTLEHTKKPSRGAKKSSNAISVPEPNEGAVDASLPEQVLRQLPQSESSSEQDSITFENLQKALLKFTPRGFHYPSRRIVVVLPEGERQTTRAFHLGHANVRAVLIEPENSVELFLFATKQLIDFRKNQNKTSVCVSGGGLEGYIYGLGILNALDACLLEKDSTQFDIYCGVSSGALLCTSMAAGITSDELLKQLYKRKGRLEPLTLGVIFDLATSEIFKRFFGAMLSVSSLDPAEVVSRIQGLVPLGFFKGDKLRGFIERQLLRVGVRDNLASLEKELYISATDLDTGEHVVFGEEPWRDVRISQAVRASTALPPFYLPERVNGHWFTDGQLTSSSDFNIAIEKGAGLVILIDPMVAFTSNTPGVVMANGGYFSAVQAIKSLVHTRSSSMLKHAMDLNPDVDFLVFRPTDEVMEAMAGNPMKYRLRTEIAELGYRSALNQILTHYEAFSHKLAKHGFRIRPASEIRELLE